MYAKLQTIQNFRFKNITEECAPDDFVDKQTKRIQKWNKYSVA